MNYSIHIQSFQETIEDHKKNYVAGNESDLIYMFLEEMYSGKGPSAGFTGSLFNILIKKKKFLIHDFNIVNHIQFLHFSDDQLVLILMDLFIAGTITTATTLDFLFLQTLIHQDVQRRLHQELDSVVGQRRLVEISDKQKYVELEF